jgi:hypothetical protein
VTFAVVPDFAAWRHVGSRDGFELTFFERMASGLLVRGVTAAVEGSDAWAVRYEIEVSEQWLTRSAHVTNVLNGDEREVTLSHDGRGCWLVNDVVRPDLKGCLDVDLESSAMTNTFPVQRLSLGGGRRQSAPAAYVSATELDVQRLEQFYTRIDEQPRFHYEAPALRFTAELSYDTGGLIVDYPGLAQRAR